MRGASSKLRLLNVRTLGLILLILGGSALLGAHSSPFLMLLVSLPLGLFLLLQQPGWGLVALAALSFTLPLELGTGTEVSLTPPTFLIPAIMVAWLGNGLWKGTLSLPASRTTLPLLLFVGSGFLSLLAGSMYWDPAVPRAGNLLIVQLAQLAIFALSAAAFFLAGNLGRQTRWLQRTTWVFLGLAAIVVLIFVFPRVHSLLGFVSPMRAGQWSTFWIWLAALSAGQLLFNQHLGTAAKLALLGLLVAAVYVLWFVMQMWASGWLPFTATLLVILWLWVRRRNHLLTWLLPAAAVGLAILLYPMVFAHTGGEQEMNSSWGGRLALYQSVLDLVKEHPILGLGPAAYRHYGFNRQLSLGFGSALYVRPNVSSHNNFIDIYAQLGLVGLGLFFWFVIELGFLGRRLNSLFHGDFADGYVQAALGGLAGCLVAMFLVDWFLPFIYNVSFYGFRTSALAWMFLGGLVALEQIANSQQMDSELPLHGR